MTIIRSIVLHSTAGGSDKIYALDLVADADGTFTVNYGNGRRGSALATGTKLAGASEAKAQATFDKVVKEKIGKGYRPIGGTDHDGAAPSAAVAVMDARRTAFTPQLANAADEMDADRLITSPDWVAQEKFDGERRGIIVDNDGAIYGANRRGLSVALSDPLKARLAHLPAGTILDAEHVGERLHVFDILQLGATNHLAACSTLEDRLAVLRGLPCFAKDCPHLQIVSTATTPFEKISLMAEVKERGGEGLVFKRRGSAYSEGRPHSGGDWLKLKFYKTLSAIVSRHNDQRSVALTLLGSGGEEIAVGNVTVPGNHGMPVVGSVVEVRYLYAFESSGALYQPVYLGLRSDIEPAECLASQRVFKDSAPFTQAA